MNRLLAFAALTLALLGTSFPAANAGEPGSIVGHWFYFMKIYQGREMPEGPDATLRLHFEFTADGVSHLYWWHEGEHDHCERRGHYSWENGLLVDTVDWVDPGNTYGCNQDPDMQLGKTTRTPVTLRDGNLVMRLQLGDDELFYVWKNMDQHEGKHEVVGNGGGSSDNVQWWRKGGR